MGFSVDSCPFEVILEVFNESIYCEFILMVIGEIR